MNRTLALIKPDAVDRNIIGEIITQIEQLDIQAAKAMQKIKELL